MDTDFIDWNGEAECPVPAETRVEVKNTKGWVMNAPAGMVIWAKVVAYRVVGCAP